jgi:hypothetical protein
MQALARFPIGGWRDDTMSGFGNGFETEALPVGRNSPQKFTYGLYAEQLSGSLWAGAAAMSSLVISPNLHDPDAFYAALVTVHQGLTDEQSELLIARLILILANHVGGFGVPREAPALARHEKADPIPSAEPR